MSDGLATQECADIKQLVVKYLTIRGGDFDNKTNLVIMHRNAKYPATFSEHESSKGAL
jgi:hypothetical protein